MARGMLFGAEMPGIVGVVDANASRERLRALAERIAARIAVHARLHIDVERAPTPPAVLGRVDLGVLDPSPAPATSADGSCRLVLHGEVAGHPGGARALLDAYLVRGVAALRGLSGSFALALWDGHARRLHLVNDRFGLRNVYYCTPDRSRFLFAPQMTALLADARLARTLDPQALAEFLTFQCVLRDRTLLADVRLLPPATLLTFEPGRRLTLETLWRPRYRTRDVARTRHARDLADALRAATARALDGDIRTGLPLSGGLDSRTLLAALPGGRGLPTITYGRPG